MPEITAIRHCVTPNHVMILCGLWLLLQKKSTDKYYHFIYYRYDFMNPLQDEWELQTPP